MWDGGRNAWLKAVGPQVNVLDDRGVAGGIADINSDGTSEAVLWTPDGAVRPFGLVPGGNFSWILGTNALGDYTGDRLSVTDRSIPARIRRPRGRADVCAAPG